MPGNSAIEHVAAIQVRIDGALLAPEIRDMVVEVRVRDSLGLPATAVVRLTDPRGERVDDRLFEIGKDLEIRAGAIGDRSAEPIFKGEIVAFEPEFKQDGIEIAIRGYDKSHRLKRGKKVRTFQQVSASDIVKKVLGEAGLRSDVTSTDTVYEFFQQSAETDRELIARLARANDFFFHVDGDTGHFEAVNGGSGAPVSLKYTNELLSFRPRVSAVQQVKTVEVRGWSPDDKREVVGSSGSGQVTSGIGVQQKPLTGAFGSAKVLIADRTVQDSGEANTMATSALNQFSEAYVEAEGTCLGNPAVLAGKKVKIEGVGQKLSGTYVVSASDHVYRGKTGYKTSFTISGRSDRSLLDLVHPPERRDWTRHLVVGLVTNVNDPDGLGRVKVKYPSLSADTESTWARVVTLAAGNARGVLMLPRIDEEVVVAFENGDARRPLVVGSVFNGKDQPGAELLADNRDDQRKGDFVVASDTNATVHTKKDIFFTSDQNLVIEVKKDQSLKLTGNQKSDINGSSELKAGTTYKVEAGASVSIKGANVSVEATGALTLKGATVSIESQGPAAFKGAVVDVQGSGVTNIKGGIVNLG
jgi:phage protein D/phage baseplate assembly protein gpV